MQMTEPFAASIAAVAPVLVLVAAVELVNSDRRTTAILAEIGDEMERDRADGLPPPAGEAAHKYLLPFMRSVLGQFIAFVWAVFGIFQVVAVALSLVWLATPEAKPEADLATVCLVAILGGMVWLIVFPLIRSVFSPLAHVSRLERIAREWREPERQDASPSATADGS
ncbi:hypothetical protein HRW23_24610 [Streptomyces lunaelactis]|nr:hypothetical protein [Streptomyces lunaelactis]NUK10370.1 hypothetical protein [Streptomyces lunaelactis]NUK37258.1 hypothetical protein [Streptomyces lunaelactis]NUK44914.1 hypothetical protein [Streptomyces lunaelactis]NUK60449.1 hypothetical protein [Streptomyces lunaelactis]NUK73840.1 hypothetical protein [Streptomyces lunaelactis]